MSIHDFVILVNEMKKDNMSIEQIQSATLLNIGMTYKTFKRKLNKLGYKYVNNQFVKEINCVTDCVTNKVTTCNTNNVTDNCVTENITSTIDNKSLENDNLEIENLKNKIAELENTIKEKQNIIDIVCSTKNIDETIVRSFRVSKTLVNDFVGLCKSKKIKQTHAINKALTLWIEFVSK